MLAVLASYFTSQQGYRHTCLAQPLPLSLPVSLQFLSMVTASPSCHHLFSPAESCKGLKALQLGVPLPLPLREQAAHFSDMHARGAQTHSAGVLRAENVPFSSPLLSLLPPPGLPACLPPWSWHRLPTCSLHSPVLQSAGLALPVGAEEESWPESLLRVQAETRCC